MNSKNRSVIKLLFFAAGANLFLAILKFLGGILGDSEALISDAIHSLTDVLSSLIVMLGIFFSGKRNDSSHKYGHERMECIASQLLSILLFFTGLSIGNNTLQSIINEDYKQAELPNMFALAVAGVSIGVKELMFWITMHFHKKYELISLKADAWHQRIDALSSVGSLLGIAGAILGFPICDVLAGFIIALFIIKISVDIFIEACNRMVDKSCDAKLESEIKSEVLLCDGVAYINELKSRLFGAKVILDIYISINSNYTLVEAYMMANRIETMVQGKFDIVKKCSVFVVPQV